MCSAKASSPRSAAALLGVKASEAKKEIQGLSEAGDPALKVALQAPFSTLLHLNSGPFDRNLSRGAPPLEREFNLAILSPLKFPTSRKRGLVFFTEAKGGINTDSGCGFIHATPIGEFEVLRTRLRFGLVGVAHKALVCRA